MPHAPDRLPMSWAGNEVLRWPVFDPVHLDATDAGLGVRRDGFGARLTGASSVPAIPWRDCTASRVDTGRSLVQLQLAEHGVQLHGVGAEIALGLIHAAGEGAPSAALPWTAGALPGVLSWSDTWIAAGPGGVALLRAGPLARARVQCWSPGEIKAVQITDDGAACLQLIDAPTEPLPACPDLLRGLAWAMRGWAPPWDPGELPEPRFTTEIERPVVWTARPRSVRPAWLRAGPEGLELVGADGSSLAAPAEALRRIDDGEADDDTVTLRAHQNLHVLHGRHGEPLAGPLWSVLRERMYRGDAAHALDAGWRQGVGTFTRIRLESSLGTGWESGPVTAAIEDGSLWVALGEPTPLAPGASVRVELTRGRSRILFSAQFAGTPDPEGLPPGLARARQLAGEHGTVVALRPLQARPTVAPQRRELYRLEVLAAEVRLTLSMDSGVAAQGTAHDISGQGVRALLDTALSVEPGALGHLQGLAPLLGEEVASVRVRVVYAIARAEGGCAVGLRLEDLTPAAVDRLHARVLALDRTRA